MYIASIPGSTPKQEKSGWSSSSWLDVVYASATIYGVYVTMSTPMKYIQPYFTVTHVISTNTIVQVHSMHVHAYMYMHVYAMLPHYQAENKVMCALKCDLK